MPSSLLLKPTSPAWFSGEPNEEGQYLVGCTFHGEKQPTTTALWADGKWWATEASKSPMDHISVEVWGDMPEWSAQ